jgi:tRNA G18 (ribose-2'-O)-methylase SpoU
MQPIADPSKPRNVVDQYKWLSNDEILADLADKRHNFSILLCNLKNDVNIGAAIRSHAAFLGQDIILYGHKSFNRAPSLGAYAYSVIKHLKFVEEIEPILGEYDEVIACDFIAGRSQSIWETSFEQEKKTLFCFGHEYDGLPAPLLERCHRVVHIPMFAIVMNEYVRGLYVGDPCRGE